MYFNSQMVISQQYSFTEIKILALLIHFFSFSTSADIVTQTKDCRFYQLYLESHFTCHKPSTTTKTIIMDILTKLCKLKISFILIYLVIASKLLSTEKLHDHTQFWDNRPLLCCNIKRYDMQWTCCCCVI